MHILQVHNKYKFTGGEWTVLNQEYGLLEKDNSVDQYIVDNRKELNTPFSFFKLLFRTHYNPASKRRVARQLESGRYDIMHVHNFFPLLSPSVFDAARKAGVPSVMTLHNFRLIHPNGLLFHNGEMDERSVKGSAYACVMDGVYRNSKIQTAVVAHMIEFHRKKKTWHRVPSAFIALSEFSKQKLVEGGLPEERIFVKPNFMEDPFSKSGGIELNAPKKDQFLYAGRISEEKGVEDLVDCWMAFGIKSTLEIAGDGPQKERLMEKSKMHTNIKWPGFLPKEEILQKMAASKALLFPTRWIEGFPLTLVEALAMGCPVLTSRIGNPKDIITDGETGLHFEPGNIDDLRRKVERMLLDKELPEKLGHNARREYLEKYTPEKNLNRLMEIYELAARFEERLRSIS